MIKLILMIFYNILKQVIIFNNFFLEFFILSLYQFNTRIKTKPSFNKISFQIPHIFIIYYKHR